MTQTESLEEKPSEDPTSHDYQAGGWREPTNNLERDPNKTSHIGDDMHKLDQASAPSVTSVVKLPDTPVSIVSTSSNPETGEINQEALESLRKKIESNPNFASQMRTHYGLLGEIFVPAEKITYLNEIISDFPLNEKLSSYINKASGEITIQFLRTVSMHIKDIKKTCGNNPNILLKIKSNTINILPVSEMLSSEFNHTRFEKVISEFKSWKDGPNNKHIKIWAGTRGRFGFKTNHNMLWSGSPDAKVEDLLYATMNLAIKVMNESKKTGDNVGLSDKC